MTNILLLESWRLFYRGKVTLPAIPVNKEHCQLFQFYKDQVSNDCSHPKLHHGVPWGELSSESHSVMSDSLRPRGLYSPWNSPGQNTGVGSLSLLQGIFPTQGLNSGLPHCGQILYQLSHQRSPRTLEWVAYPFCKGSSQPRNQTGVSCIAGRFFTN